MKKEKNPKIDFLIRLIVLFLLNITVVTFISLNVYDRHLEFRKSKVQEAVDYVIGELNVDLNQSLGWTRFFSIIMQNRLPLETNISQITNNVFANVPPAKKLYLAPGATAQYVLPNNPNDPLLGTQMFSKFGDSIIDRDNNFVIDYSLDDETGHFMLNVFVDVYDYSSGHKNYWGNVCLVYDFTEKIMNSLHKYDLENDVFDLNKMVFKSKMCFDGKELTIVSSNDDKLPDNNKLVSETELKKGKIVTEAAYIGRFIPFGSLMPYVIFGFLALLLVFILEVIILILVEKQKKNRNEEKIRANFISNAIYEIKTSMNSIIGINHLILKEHIDNKVREHTNSIDNEALKLHKVLENMLELSKISALKYKSKNERYYTQLFLDDIIDYTKDRANRKGLTLLIDSPDNLPLQLFGDRTAIKLMLINVIDTSLNSTEDGHIKISAFSEDCRDKKNLKLSFMISDTGMGFKHNEAEEVFDAYKALNDVKNIKLTEQSLALTLARRIAKIMGGDITMQTEYGKGTVYVISIYQNIVDDKKNTKPILDKKTIEIENKSKSFKGKKALVIDDNEVSLKVAQGFLRQFGIETDIASSGKEGIEILEKKKYDILLIDHLMPEMDGFETIKNIKEKNNFLNKNTPIVLLTANAMADTIEISNDAKYDEFMSKPIVKKNLEEMLNKLL